MIGKQVKVLWDYGNVKKGWIGTVRGMGPPEGTAYHGYLSVEFPQLDRDGGHVCGGQVPSGAGFWMKLGYHVGLVEQAGEDPFDD